MTIQPRPRTRLPACGRDRDHRTTVLAALLLAASAAAVVYVLLGVQDRPVEPAGVPSQAVRG
ncbi:hypothetical protein ACFXN2_12010 [Streptomyces kronopolitis]|uniref:hypothetical protein n=1 Tax=Streptomyces TaxID=1883 RepID=UPI0020BF764E|nr:MULTISPECIES: hypothetical protein [Streptomyces]MCL6298448.1 hypothetical protein [Streptomyces kronopolitis]GLW13455.1 hypothetical protein Stsp01_01980 [Streptomyces sp. NBRC 13847]